MDGQWDHQRVRQDTQGCKPFQTCTVLFPLYTAPVTDGIILTARRRRSGVDVYARPGDDTRGLEGGMISDIGDHAAT